MADQDATRRGLADSLKRYLDAAAGFGSVSRERAEAIIAELAERGEPRARDIRKAARGLVGRSERDRRDLQRLIQKEIRRLLDVRNSAIEGRRPARSRKRSSS